MKTKAPKTLSDLERSINEQVAQDLTAEINKVTAQLVEWFAHSARREVRLKLCAGNNWVEVTFDYHAATALNRAIIEFLTPERRARAADQLVKNVRELTRRMEEKRGNPEDLK